MRLKDVPLRGWCTILIQVVSKFALVASNSPEQPPQVSAGTNTITSRLFAGTHIKVFPVAAVGFKMKEQTLIFQHTDYQTIALCSPHNLTCAIQQRLVEVRLAQHSQVVDLHIMYKGFLRTSGFKEARQAFVITLRVRICSFFNTCQRESLNYRVHRLGNRNQAHQ